MSYHLKAIDKKGQILLGARAWNLERAVFQHNPLNAPKGEKLDSALHATDRVRARFGFDSVRLARSLEPGEEPRKRKR